MNLRLKLLEIRKERNFSTFQDYFKAHPIELKTLIQLIDENEAYPIPEYASWVLTHLCKDGEINVQPFYSAVTDKLFVNKNQTIRRNLINVIDHLKLTDYKESEFIDLLISFIQDYENKVAVQVYSIQVLTRFVFKYPELKEEILEVITLHSENKSPAYNASTRKFMRRTNKI